MYFVQCFCFKSFLGQLRPSRELLEYYRKKIAEYDEEHDHMVSKLEEYRVTYEEQVSTKFLNFFFFLIFKMSGREETVI